MSGCGSVLANGLAIVGALSIVTAIGVFVGALHVAHRDRAKAAEALDSRIAKRFSQGRPE